jgi:hypothetical protein
MLDPYDLVLQEERELEKDPIKEFYHELLKKYVALVGSPFVLQRLCMHLYKHYSFDMYFDVETLDELYLELL